MARMARKVWEVVRFPMPPAPPVSGTFADARYDLEAF